MPTIRRPDDLHHVGTLVAIVSSERQPSGDVQVVLEGISAFGSATSIPARLLHRSPPISCANRRTLRPNRACSSSTCRISTSRYADARGRCRPKSRTWSSAPTIRAIWPIAGDPDRDRRLPPAGTSGNGRSAAPARSSRGPSGRGSTSRRWNAASRTACATRSTSNSASTTCASS